MSLLNFKRLTTEEMDEWLRFLFGFPPGCRSSIIRRYGSADAACERELVTREDIWRLWDDGANCGGADA